MGTLRAPDSSNKNVTTTAVCTNHDQEFESWANKRLNTIIDKTSLQGTTAELQGVISSPVNDAHTPSNVKTLHAISSPSNILI